MACSFNLPECYSRINFGDCSCETVIKLKAEETRFEVETKFWSIVDLDDFANVPSDMWAALELVCRQARNRDMWKGQSERQAQTIEHLRTSLVELVLYHDVPDEAQDPVVRPLLSNALAAIRKATA